MIISTTILLDIPKHTGTFTIAIFISRYKYYYDTTVSKALAITTNNKSS